MKIIKNIYFSKSSEYVIEPYKYLLPTIRYTFPKRNSLSLLILRFLIWDKWVEIRVMLSKNERKNEKADL